MKDFNWVIFILLIFSSSLFAQNVDSLKVIKQTPFDFSKRVVYDHNRNIIGNVKGIKDFDKLEGFSNVVYRGKIKLINGKTIEINPLEEVIICEDANRIFAFGPTQIDHWWDGYPYLLIFDLEGNLISNYGMAVNGRYSAHVSKSGDIYFIGKSEDEKLKGKVIKKIDKDGKLKWETYLQGLFSTVRGIQVIDSSGFLAVLRSDTGVTRPAQSEVFILNKDGEIISTSTSNWALNNILSMGKNKIFCSQNGRYNIMNVNELKLDQFDSMPRGTISPLFIRVSPKREKFVVLGKDKLIRVFKLNKDHKLSLEKEMKLVEPNNFRGFYFLDEETILIIYKNKYSTIR